MDNRDHRGAARIRHTVKTRLTWAGGRVHGYSLDISATGLFIETATLLPLETEVRVWFELENEAGIQPVVARGQVVRSVSSVDSDPGGIFLGMGVGFSEIEEGELALRALVGDGTPLHQRHAPEPGAERRAAPRVAVGIPVWWGEADPPQKKGRLSNLSETGALVLVAGELLPLHSRVFISFNLPMDGRVVEVRGIARVMRAVSQGTLKMQAMGLEFEASSVDLCTLSKFIASRLKAAQEAAELAEVVDNSWRVEWGHVSRRFLIRATAALFSGTMAIELLFKALYAFT